MYDLAAWNAPTLVGAAVVAARRVVGALAGAGFVEGSAG
jgi:hypothetical protein